MITALQLLAIEVAIGHAVWTYLEIIDADELPRLIEWMLDSFGERAIIPGVLLLLSGCFGPLILVVNCIFFA